MSKELDEALDRDFYYSIKRLNRQIVLMLMLAVASQIALWVVPDPLVWFLSLGAVFISAALALYYLWLFMRAYKALN